MDGGISVRTFLIVDGVLEGDPASGLFDLADAPPPELPEILVRELHTCRQDNVLTSLVEEAMRYAFSQLDVDDED